MLEKREHRSFIKEAIEEQVQKEERRILEKAQKRIAQVHAKKATEATRAAEAIEKIREQTRIRLEKA